MIYYLDSSVIVELIRSSSKAASILPQLDGLLFTSKLGRVESIRTIMKLDARWIERTLKFLEVIQLIEIRDEILERVESYGSDISLKTSDAIHVATAQMLFHGTDGALVTLDRQMGKNAELMGLQVISA